MLLTPEILKINRAKKGLSQQAVADAIGVTLKSYQYYEAGDRNPKYDKVKKLVELLDIDLVTNVPQITFREQLKNKKVETKEFRVPLVTIKARAGYLSSYENIDLINSLDKYAIPPGVSYTGAIWRYFEVDGDSMEPALQSGDYVLCSQVPQDDWEHNVKNYYVYVLVTETEIMIKRVFVKDDGTWVLISDNESHSPQKLFDPKLLKELWVFRRLIKKTISPKKEFKIKI